MALGFLMNQVKNAIMDHADQQQHTGFDPSALLGQVEGLFNQHAQYTGQQIQPASQDPYGDAANQAAGNVLPASQDPYGDPADAARGIRPASQDPYGDPADAAQGIRPASQDPYGD